MCWNSFAVTFCFYNLNFCIFLRYSDFSNAMLTYLSWTYGDVPWISVTGVCVTPCKITERSSAIASMAVPSSLLTFTSAKNPSACVERRHLVNVFHVVSPISSFIILSLFTFVRFFYSMLDLKPKLFILSMFAQVHCLSWVFGMEWTIFCKIRILNGRPVPISTVPE